MKTLPSPSPSLEYKRHLPSEHVDHREPWVVGGVKDWRLFWDRRNWQALCFGCHNAKTAEDRAAGRC